MIALRDEHIVNEHNTLVPPYGVPHREQDFQHEPVGCSLGGRLQVPSAAVSIMIWKMIL